MQPDRHGRAARTPPDPRRRPDHGFRLSSHRRFAALLRDVLETLPDPVAAALRGASVRVVAVPPEEPQPAEAVPLLRVERRAGRPPALVVYRRPLELRALSTGDLAELLRLAVAQEAAAALGLELGPEWDEDEG